MKPYFTAKLQRFKNRCYGAVKYSLTLNVSELLEDPEASGIVFPCTGCFAVGTAAFGVKVAAGVVKPVTTTSKRVFEAHHVTILHWGTINSVPGENLESVVDVGQPQISLHRTDTPVENQRCSSGHNCDSYPKCG